ncbi:MAG: chromate transporter [Oscillospiraceae bacterium]|nr:chromate transporter [Oscillospiraceae bacterium]
MCNTRKRDLKVLWPLFVIFFKAGTFTFTGGLAMLPVIEKEIVEKQGLLSREEFLEYATLSQTLPGVVAINCANFVGKRAAGIAGMIAASLGAALPAFILMLAATVAIQYVPQTGPAIGAIRGIRAASAALVLSAAFTLGANNIKSAFSIIVMLAAFASVLLLNISTPLVVLAAGAVGYAYQLFSRKKGGKRT